MDNKINFTGAFWVKNPPTAAKKQLEILSGKHKQIFENFDNTSNMFYVVRNGKDKGIAQFITENNLDFIFFPHINTKSGLDPLYPENAVKMIQKRQHFVTKPNVLLKMFKLLPERPNFDMNIDGIAHALKINEKDLSISTKNGVTYAFTKDNKHIFKSTPTNKYGENYVYLNKGKYSERYLVHGDTVVFKYPGNAKYFDENFDNCVAQALYCEV